MVVCIEEEVDFCQDSIIVSSLTKKYVYPYFVDNEHYFCLSFIFAGQLKCVTPKKVCYSRRVLPKSNTLEQS